MREDPELLKGVLAEDEEVPADAERLRIPEVRCAACAARGVRCFHEQVSYETPERQEYETR